MLLVYAMTAATQHGWATGSTIGLLAGLGRADPRLLRDRVALEGAAPAAPDLPLRTLTASNVSGLLMAARSSRSSSS
jgi:hypothetical protein